MQFEFFLKNSFWIIFFLFFLFQLAMVSFAFLLSSEARCSELALPTQPLLLGQQAPVL